MVTVRDATMNCDKYITKIVLRQISQEYTNYPGRKIQIYCTFLFPPDINLTILEFSDYMQLLDYSLQLALFTCRNSMVSNSTWAEILNKCGGCNNCEVYLMLHIQQHQRKHGVDKNITYKCQTFVTENMSTMHHVQPWHTAWTFRVFGEPLRCSWTETNCHTITDKVSILPAVKKVPSRRCHEH